MAEALRWRPPLPCGKGWGYAPSAIALRFRGRGQAPMVEGTQSNRPAAPYSTAADAQRPVALSRMSRIEVSPSRAAYLAMPVTICPGSDGPA